MSQRHNGFELRSRGNGTANQAQRLPAGDFSSWLRQTRTALRDDSGADVACGECTGCCSSSYFIQIGPEETKTLARIRKDLLVPAPGQATGHLLMGYDEHGLCPMLVSGKCSIYQQRPQTCRNYDCRVFTAAGIDAGGDDKATINRRVRLWAFSYPTQRDRKEHDAVRAAARFLQEHASSFPEGRVPHNPTELAILAIKVYDVFLRKRRSVNAAGSALSNADIAKAIVDQSKEFDARAQ